MPTVNKANTDINLSSMFDLNSSNVDHSKDNLQFDSEESSVCGPFLFRTNFK